jgi:hypothetical protein
MTMIDQWMQIRELTLELGLFMACAVPPVLAWLISMELAVPRKDYSVPTYIAGITAAVALLLVCPVAVTALGLQIEHKLTVSALIKEAPPEALHVMLLIGLALALLAVLFGIYQITRRIFKAFDFGCQATLR